MSTSGKIKLAILIIVALTNVIFPIGSARNQDLLSSILFPIVFGALAIPLLLKVNSLLRLIIIVSPRWNDNPFQISKPLIMLQFAVAFFIIAGLATMTGTLIKYHHFNTLGLGPLFFGIGIYIGIQLTLLWLKDKKGS